MKHFVWSLRNSYRLSQFLQAFSAGTARTYMFQFKLHLNIHRLTIDNLQFRELRRRLWFQQNIQQIVEINIQIISCWTCTQECWRNIKILLRRRVGIFYSQSELAVIKMNHCQVLIGSAINRLEKVSHFLRKLWRMWNILCKLVNPLTFVQVRCLGKSQHGELWRLKLRMHCENASLQQTQLTLRTMSIMFRCKNTKPQNTQKWHNMLSNDLYYGIKG